MSVRPAKTQISLGIRPIWSESSLCAQWVAKVPSFLHADIEDWSDWADSHFVGFVMLRLIFWPLQVLVLVFTRSFSWTWFSDYFCQCYVWPFKQRKWVLQDTVQQCDEKRNIVNFVCCLTTTNQYGEKYYQYNCFFVVFFLLGHVFLYMKTPVQKMIILLAYTCTDLQLNLMWK